jgi:hypothetical protein
MARSVRTGHAWLEVDRPQHYLLPFDFRTPNDGGRRKRPSTIFVANGRSTLELDSRRHRLGVRRPQSFAVATDDSRHWDERLHQNAANW